MIQRERDKHKKEMKKENDFDKASWRIFWAVKGREIKVLKEWKSGLYRGNRGAL